VVTNNEEIIQLIDTALSHRKDSSPEEKEPENVPAPSIDITLSSGKDSSFEEKEPKNVSVPSTSSKKGFFASNLISESKIDPDTISEINSFKQELEDFLKKKKTSGKSRMCAVALLGMIEQSLGVFNVTDTNLFTDRKQFFAGDLGKIVKRHEKIFDLLNPKKPKKNLKQP
jgi:hypothetical protein